MFLLNFFFSCAGFLATAYLSGSLFYICTYLNFFSLLLCYFLLYARLYILNFFYFFCICTLCQFNYCLIHGLLLLYVWYVKIYYINFWTLILLFVHVYFYILTNYFQVIFLLEFYALILILAILITLLTTIQINYRVYLYTLLSYYFYSFLFSIVYISIILYSHFLIWEFRLLESANNFYLLLHLCLIGKLGFYLFFIWKQRILLLFGETMQYVYIIYYYIPLCIWYGYFLTTYFFYIKQLHYLIYINLCLCLFLQYWLPLISKYSLLFVYSGTLNFAFFCTIVVLIF